MSEIFLTTVIDLVNANIIAPPMDGNHGEAHPKSEDYVSDGIPFIMASDLVSGHVDFQKCKFIQKNLADTLRKGFAYPDDVLLSHKATIGRTAIIQKNPYPYVMLTPQVTFYRVINKTKLLPHFLRYYFETKDFQDVFSAWAGGGSTRSYLGITAQLKLPIFIPPLHTQTAISSILGFLDGKIDLNRRTNETLEAMARALFRDWFVDFGPTRAKMAGEAPYLAPELWELFPNRLDDEGKPEGWHISSIGDETDIVGGSTPSTSNPIFWNGDHYWATPKDLSGLNSPVLSDTSRKITDEGLTQISSGLLPSGSVLLSSRAPVGYTAITTVPLAINQGFIGVKCTQNLSAPYVFLWMKESMELILQNANGSTFQEISKKNFRPLPIIKASHDLLKAFDTQSQGIFDKIIVNDAESRTLAQLRDLLLPKLMSGEISIRDAEKMVENAA